MPTSTGRAIIDTSAFPADIRLQGGRAMPGKIVHFDDETFALMNLLRRERRRSFQQLADEAFRDLLEKHGRPLKLKDQLRESLDEAPSKPRRRAK